MPPSTFPAPLTMSDNRDVVEGAVMFSFILILSLMYFTVIRVESLRGAQHQKWSKDIEMSPAAAQQPALIKPQEIQPGFLWHQLSPQNPQRTEHHKVLPISDSEISSTAVIVSTHVAYQRTLQSAITLKNEAFCSFMYDWGLLHTPVECLNKKTSMSQFFHLLSDHL